MKKILFWSAVTLFAAVSCNKELENTPVTEGETVSFIATVDGPETKTVLGSDDTPMWAGEESITVHDGTTGFLFTANAAATGEAEAVFTCENATLGDQVIAVYPSGSYTVNMTAKTVAGINIPSVQYLSAGTYNPASAAAVAYSEDNILNFKNAVALLAFKVKDEGITYGAFYLNDQGVDVSGSFTATLGENNVPVLSSTDQQHYVDFKIDENGTALTPNTTYYLAIAPAEIPATGFAVQLNGMEVKKFAQEFTFERNVIYDLGVLELPEVSDNWSVCGTVNNWGDTEMTLEGGWYVAKSLTITTSDRFKFRTDGAWAVNRGGIVENAVADKEYEVSQNGADIYVAVSAIYDVYLSKDATKMKIVKVGDYNTPDPEPDFDFTNFPGVDGKVVVYAETEYNTLYMWGDGNNYAGTWPGLAAEVNTVEDNGKTYKIFELQNADAIGKTVQMILNDGNGRQTQDSAAMTGASVMIVDGTGSVAVLVASK